MSIGVLSFLDQPARLKGGNSSDQLRVISWCIW